MDKLGPSALIQDSVELFSLPDIYFQISEMIKNPKYTAKDMGQVIGNDPGLSMRLLKIVNSSFYGFQARIDTISRAITIIGIEDLQNLVLATSVIDKFSNIPSELVNMTDFWIESVHCGVIAKLLAKESSVLHSERLFLTGLLHNVGSLVIFHKLPEQASEILQAANYDRRLVPQLEQKILGFTHADVGSELIKSWGLPESISEAIACYITPEKAQQYKLDSYLLCLASRLVNVGAQDVSIEDVVDEFTVGAMSITRLDIDQIVNVMEEVQSEFSQVFELMAPAKN